MSVAVLALAVMSTGAAHANSSPLSTAPVVASDGGLLRGVATETGRQFLGIPYAAPPIGPLRWQPPQPAAPWPGVRDASELGSPCAQLAGSLNELSTAEDCLFLNVHTPPASTHDNPVMVWFHGGGLVNGSGGLYNPVDLVQHGVVVVTVNYRLGALGFLAHAALADREGGPSGNYGLMDQQAALRWVARNIAGFGGNPRNVTISGQSAGGLSVLAQLVSPAARGLMSRAVAMSGAYALTQKSLADAETDGRAFADKVGCADQSAACLRALPVRELLDNQDQTYVPNIDGKVLGQSIDTALAAGRFARVPVLNGSTADEWRLFVAQSEAHGDVVTTDNYQGLIEKSLKVSPETAAAVAAEYPPNAYPSPALAFSAMGTDATFACPALTVTTSTSRYVPTYGYEFNDENAPPLVVPPVSFPQGAGHAYDLQYLFKFTVSAGELSLDQQRLAATMVRYWTGFAKFGAPRGAPFWPWFDEITQEIQSLIPPQPRPETDFAAKHRCAFWSSSTATGAAATAIGW
ncbi:carboxylesterase/lipase family protein [Kutzneria sp. NPDC052558]|uniref:carboxylesterase/lipase family protein n=1 Tax=Kutzneria sp. NPDC052558 TaxID=3364121 RepID=UPI0037C96337